MSTRAFVLWLCACLLTGLGLTVALVAVQGWADRAAFARASVEDTERYLDELRVELETAQAAVRAQGDKAQADARMDAVEIAAAMAGAWCPSHE